MFNGYNAIGPVPDHHASTHKGETMKKFLIGLVIFIVAAVATFLTAYHVGLYHGQSPHEGTRAITGATLIDGTGADPVENGVVVIEDARIAAVGPADEITVPEEAEILEAGGLTLLPGLIDAHVHFGAPEVDEPEDWEELSVPLLIWDGLRLGPDTRRAFIENGVTTIRSAGDSDEWIVDVRDEIAEGEIEGPRIYTAGPSFTAPGGHPAGTIYEGIDYLVETATRQVEHPDHARSRVEELDQLGVDFIKTVVDDGRPNEPIPRLEPEILEAIVDEAHDRDLTVTTHWGDPEDAQAALDAGVDALEHVSVAPIPDELAERIAEQDVPVVPTLTVVEALLPDRVFDMSLDNVIRLHEAGVRLLAGSDTANPGVPFGESLHRELELLVEAGLDPHQALRAATADNAELLGAEDELGTLEPGKRADLVAVEGDPLQDISATRETRLVLREGKLLVDERE